MPTNRRPFLPTNTQLSPEHKADMSDVISRLLDARALTQPGRDQAVQNVAILNAIADALDLEHPIPGLTLSDIGFVLPIALPQVGINVAMQAQATLNGVTGLSQTWIHLEGQEIQANDTITSPAWSTLHGVPPIDNYTRWDHVFIDIAAGQPTTAISEVTVASVDTFSGNLGLMPNFVLAGVNVGTNFARTRLQIHGPLWSHPGRGIYIHINSPDHDTVTPPTLTVSATGVTAAPGSDLGGGSATITGNAVRLVAT